MSFSATIVIEDDKEIREVILSALEAEGLPSLSAQNGAEALKLLESVDYACLMLVDVMMPEVNGREFLQLLAELERQKPVGHKAIVMSGSVGGEAVALEFGAEFIAKPFELSSLIKKIKAICPIMDE